MTFELFAVELALYECDVNPAEGITDIADIGDAVLSVMAKPPTDGVVFGLTSLFRGVGPTPYNVAKNAAEYVAERVPELVLSLERAACRTSSSKMTLWRECECGAVEAVHMKGTMVRCGSCGASGKTYGGKVGSLGPEPEGA